MKYVVVGVSSKNGTIHRLDRMKKSGKYQLTAPGLTADERKREENYTLVDDIGEAVKLIEEEGCYARMTNLEGEGGPDIIARPFIQVFRMP